MPDLLDDRETAMRIAKDAKDKTDEINGRLWHKLGTAAVARFNGGMISGKTVHKKAY